MFLKRLFGNRNRITDINVVQEMSSWVTAYTNEFFSEYDYLEEGEEESEIFESARNLIFTFGEKTLLKQLKKNNITVDIMTLNIIHNVAMTSVMEGNIIEVISRKGKTQAATDICNFINKKKLDLHYISPKQYEENDKLIENIRHSLL